jgi:hypothetical protein
MPLIPALWISEFEASLIYKVSSRTARATQRDPVSKKKTKTKTKPTKQTNKKDLLYAQLYAYMCVSV